MILKKHLMQVGVDKVNIIGWVDLTKNGVLGQKDVNRVGLWCEKLIAKNLTGCSAHLSEEFGPALMLPRFFMGWF